MESAGQSIELPIFELPLAALPGERVPLHIFEERYRLLVAHCLETEAPFGIVLRTDEGSREIGCAAEVTEILERFDDGRVNILATGSWRFRASRHYEGADFPMAQVERLPEPGAGVAEEEAAADPGAAIEAFRRLLEAIGSRAEPPSDLRTAYGIAGRVETPVETKQQLLECESEAERLELLVTALELLIAEVERSKRVAERAQSNGHASVEGLQPPERG